MGELSNIEEKIRELMEKEFRRDTEFRYLIVTTEVGDLGKYITHDPLLNPSARPHGSKDDEILAYGQALVQLIALAQLRGIEIEPALKAGLENWIAADWRRTEKENTSQISGLTVYNGSISGEAYVARNMAEVEIMPKGKILVMPFAKSDLVPYLSGVLAVVTDHGGRTCHLANIARELGIISIVGTEKATEMIHTGDEITVDATEDVGKVYINNKK